MNKSRSCQSKEQEGSHSTSPQHMLVSNEPCVKPNESQIVKILARILRKVEASNDVLNEMKLCLFQLYCIILSHLTSIKYLETRLETLLA